MNDTLTDLDRVTQYRDAALDGRAFTHEDLSDRGVVSAELYAIAERALLDLLSSDDDTLRQLARKPSALTDRQAAHVLNALTDDEPAIAHSRARALIDAIQSTPLGRRIGDTFVPAPKIGPVDGDDTAYDAWLMHRTRTLAAGDYLHYTICPWRPNSALGAGAHNRAVLMAGATLGYQRTDGTLDALPSIPRTAAAAFYRFVSTGE